MHILVCVKHVPDTNEIRPDQEGNISLRGVPTKLNDYDRNAVQEAVLIKERTGGTVTLLTVGPGDARRTLKEALAMGADQAYLISGPWAGGLDPAATAEILAAAASRLAAWDLMLCGEVSEDGYNAQVGPYLAGMLNLPQLTYVHQLRLEGGQATGQRTVDNIDETVAVPLPAVVTVTRRINTPRLPTALQVMKVQANRIVEWGSAQVGLTEETFAPERQATQLLEVRALETQRRRVVLAGELDTAVPELVAALEKEGVLP